MSTLVDGRKHSSFIIRDEKNVQLLWFLYSAPYMDTVYISICQHPIHQHLLNTSFLPSTLRQTLRRSRRGCHQTLMSLSCKRSLVQNLSCVKYPETRKEETAEDNVTISQFTTMNCDNNATDKWTYSNISGET